MWEQRCFLRFRAGSMAPARNGKKLYYRIKHALPGRKRLVFPALISDRKLIHALELYLSDRQGITRVVTNHYNGSVTVYHHPEIVGDRKLLNVLDHVTNEHLLRIDHRISKTEEARSRNEVPSGSHKGCWKVAGKVLGGIGFVGVFVPLIPAFPLFFLAAFCKEKADVGSN